MATLAFKRDENVRDRASHDDDARRSRRRGTTAACAHAPKAREHRPRLGSFPRPPYQKPQRFADHGGFCSFLADADAEPTESATIQAGRAGLAPPSFGSARRGLRRTRALGRARRSGRGTLSLTALPFLWIAFRGGVSLDLRQVSVLV